MTFRPEPQQELQIGDTTYRIAEHPAAPGMPYGQEGRAAVVYQLVANDKRRALKVFKPRFRIPGLVALAGRLAAFADLPGLSVCLRTVLTPQQHAALLRKYPDLIYSMLMPWIEGPTWMETLLDKRELSPEQSHSLARSLVEILAAMEARGLAHCDLSGPNLLLPALAVSPNYAVQFPVELVDVEQMYGLGLGKPDVLPGGSQGYAHRKAPEGLWEPEADRFAGAILICEMLAWCDPRVRGAAWGENYFDPVEMQQPCERYNLFSEVLRERWGRPVAQLLDQAWTSPTLYECAPFSKWLSTLQDLELSRHGAQGLAASSTVQQQTGPAPAEADPSGAGAMLAALIVAAQAAEAEGNTADALATYREARSLAREGSPEAGQIQGHIADLERRRAAEKPTLPTPVAPVQPGPPGVPTPGPTAPQTPVTQATQATQPIPIPVPTPNNQGAPANRQGFAPPQQQGPPAAFVPPVTQFDFMFDDAMMSFQRGDLQRADWLLREILRQQPAFARNGYLASRVLMDVEARMQPTAPVGAMPQQGPPPQAQVYTQPQPQPRPQPVAPIPIPMPVPATAPVSGPVPGAAAATATATAANVNRAAAGTTTARPRRNMVWVVPVILLAIVLLAGGAFAASRMLGVGPGPAPTPTLPVVVTEFTRTPTALADNLSPTPDATGTAQALLGDKATDTPEPQATDTPAPTNTEAPTLTPASTDTPVPVPTDTPLPTNTPPPAPTDTPAPPPPPPTNTPVPPPPPPTNTRVQPPTATRVPPTNTRPPQPTRTPRPAPTNTPVPPPKPTNTPAPPPPPSFSVTRVNVSVQPENSTSCPTFFQFTASITTSGTGTITYHWERSDGASTPPENLYFEAGGTKLASSTWEISASYRGWKRLVVTAPNTLTSNDANFVLTCK